MAISCFLLECAKQLIAGPKQEVSRVAMKCTERRRAAAVAFVFLKGFYAVEHIRERRAVSRYSFRSIQVAREWVALGQQGSRQGDALGLAPALAFDQQSPQTWMNW